MLSTVDQITAEADQVRLHRGDRLEQAAQIEPSEIAACVDVGDECDLQAVQPHATAAERHLHVGHLQVRENAAVHPARAGYAVEPPVQPDCDALHGTLHPAGAVTTDIEERGQNVGGSAERGCDGCPVRFIECGGVRGGHEPSYRVDPAVTQEQTRESPFGD